MKDKIKKIDKNYFLITLFCIILIIVTLPSNCLFGSITDWITQHTVFPDYFRNLFYETGNLFPSFAPSIGAGQNIFNFSYYGLYSPIFLVSYLLPFVDMTTYIIVVNIILYIVSANLFYKFFKKHYNKNTALIVSIILICASPLLFHSHRHFMFVNYIPFLLMGMFAVDVYFERGNKLLLVFSTFLIILTNYFFSVSSLSVILIYGLYVYLKTEKNITFKKIIIDGLKFIFPILLGIILSSFILLPTAYTLLNGRGVKNSNLITSLKLNLDYSDLLYSPYALGLTSLAIISVLYGFISKKEYKILSLIIFILITIPMFCLMLNGFLYIREKVFIPYLVLFGLLICNLFDNMNKLDKKYLYILIFFFMLFIIFKVNIKFILDYVVTIIIIYVFKDRKKIIYFLGILTSIIICIITNYKEVYVNNDIYINIVDDSKEISEFNYDDKYRFYHLDDNLYTTNKVYTHNYHLDSIYSSTYNKDYYNFYKNVFNNPFAYRNEMILAQNKNLLYQTYMGAKYMYSNDDMLGYEKISNHIYKNDNVLPIIYSTDRNLNGKYFDMLKYPYNLEALLSGVVTDESSIKKSETKIKKISLDYNIISKDGLKIKQVDNYVNIRACKKNKLILELKNSKKNKILLIDFKLKNEWKCSDGDSKIIINGISNTLTCKSWIYKNRNKNFHFYIGEKDLKNINIKFNKGEYNIEDINIYELDYNNVLEYVRSVSKPEYININGDNIKSKIEVNNDGYIVTSIPYDEGFTIYDNGKKVNVLKVNKAFIGFKAKEGIHNIEIKYSAPLFKEGKILSILGILITIIYIFIDNIKKIKKF